MGFCEIKKSLYFGEFCEYYSRSTNKNLLDYEGIGGSIYICHYLTLYKFLIFKSKYELK